jgi:hypothetical protein
MDLANIAAGAAAAKTGFDTLRAALGLVKDVQGVLPAGEKKDAVGASLAEAERHFKTAEAQIAQALGYSLCRCAFPPAPMLQVGYYFGSVNRRVNVHECPVCRTTDAGTKPWHRTVGEEAGREMPPAKGAPQPPHRTGVVGSRRGSWMAG